MADNNIYDIDLQRTDINVDWGGDEYTDDKPISGRVVQKFIKDNIRFLTEQAADASTRLKNIDGATGQINKMTNRLNGLDSSVTGIKENIQNIDSSINSINDSIGGIDSSISNIKDKISGVDSSISGIKDRINTIDSSIQEIHESVDSIDPEAIQQALSAFDKASLDASFQAIEEHLGALDSSKAGYFQYVEERNQYLVFASSEDYETWAGTIPHDNSLVLGYFDAPSKYDARVILVDVPASNTKYVQYGSKGNYIKATYYINFASDNTSANDPCSAKITITNQDGTVTYYETAEKLNPSEMLNVNVDDYLAEGTNRVLIRITGENTLATASTTFTIRAMALSLTDTFDITTITDPNHTLDVHWYIEGRGDKYIEWFIDDSSTGLDVDYVGAVKDNQIKELPTTGLSEGKHTLQYYAYIQNADGSRFYSDVLYRNFVIDYSRNEDQDQSSLNRNYLTLLAAFSAPIESDSSTLIEGDGTENDPIILRGITQYEMEDIEYCIYYKDHTSSKPVTITLGSESSEIEAESMVEVYTYTLRSFNYGTIPMTISCVDASTGAGEVVYFNAAVAKSPYDIAPITGNLAFAFSGGDRSNESQDKASWSYTDNNSNTYTGVLSGFDWIDNSGWYNGRLIIPDGASFVTDYAPFKRAVNNPISDTGFTFEIEFKTSHVLDEAAPLVNLRNHENAGLYITASTIEYKLSDNEIVSTKYKPEENIRVGVVIYPNIGNLDYKGLMMLYIDGILTSIVPYSSTTNLSSNTELSIIGTPNATFELKQIRCYNRALAPNDILNNFMLYRDTAEELMEVYDRNDIYVDSLISADRLMRKTPIIIITGNDRDDNIDPLQILYGFDRTHKGDYVRVDRIEVINFEHPEYNMVLENPSMRCQGTSSMDYPIKNFRFYTQKDSADGTWNPIGGNNEYTTRMWVNGEEKTKKQRLYSFKQDAQPVKCWCLKADYAESSSTHNTGVARLWNQVMKDAEVDATDIDPRYYITPPSSGKFKLCQTKAQRIASENNFGYDVRTTVDGFPITLFYHKRASDPLQFVGRYNWNNDKSTESVYGFCDIKSSLPKTDPEYWAFDDSSVQCWEIVEGDMPCNCFYDLSHWNDKTGTLGWRGSFESRYPGDDGSDEEAHRARDYREEVYVPAYEKDPETGEQILDGSGNPIPIYELDDQGNIKEDDQGNPIQAKEKIWVDCEPGELYKFCEWMNGFYGSTTIDSNTGKLKISDNIKINRFKTQKWQHLDVYKIAAYYVYLMRFGAVDQVVKNAMFTTEDGLHWYYINYDNDTINGVRNDGALKFGYDIDRQSTDPDAPTTYCYAGHESVLWNCLEVDDEFMEIVKMADAALYKAGLRYSKVIEMFNDNQSAKWAERTHNEDYIYKYLGPWVKNGDNQFSKLQGPRKSHRQWWLSNRFSRYDAINGVGSYKENYITIKPPGNAPVRQGQGVTITPASSEQIFGYSFGNNMKETGRRAAVGEEIQFNFSLSDQLQVGAQPFFYNSVYMKSFDCSRIADVVKQIDFTKVNSDAFESTITDIIMGRPDGPQNVMSVVDISNIGKVKYLENFKINNYVGIGSIDLSENMYLKVVDARYCTALKTIKLPEGAPITTLYYPANVQSIKFKDYSKLQYFEIQDGGKKVSNIEIDNCELLSSDKSFFMTWLGSKEVDDENCTLIVNKINWEDVTTANLWRLIQFHNNGGTLNLSGRIKMSARILDADLARALIAIWGEDIFKSTSAFYIDVDPTIILDGPTTIYEGDSASYTYFYIGNDERRPEGTVRFSLNNHNSELIRRGTTIDTSTGTVSTTENGDHDGNVEIYIFWGGLSGYLVVKIKKRKYPSSTLAELEIDGSNKIKKDIIYHYELKRTDPTITGAFITKWEVTGDLRNYIQLTYSEEDNACTIFMEREPYEIDSSKVVVNGALVATVYYKYLLVDDEHPEYGHMVVGDSGLKSITVGYKHSSVAMTSATNPYAMAQIALLSDIVTDESVLTVEQAAQITSGLLQPGDSYSTSIFRRGGGFSQNCTNFEEFEYFTTLNRIPVYLFYGCSKLEVINLPIGIESIDGYAFYGCTALKSIVVPRNVTSIGEQAFRNCTNLESVIFEGNVTSIGEYAFYNCPKLKSITLSSGLTSISNYTFQSSGLESIVIPNNVTTIGQSAFNNCKQLKSVVFGESVQTINYDAFSGSGLETLNIPDNVKTIRSSAFSNCKSLETVVLGDGVTSMETSVFSSCTALTSIDFGNGLTSLPYSTCYGCTALKNIHIGSGMRTMSYICGAGQMYNSSYGYSNSFYNCHNIESIIIDPNNTYFYDGSATDGQNCIINSSHNLIFGCKTSTIPSSCTSIGSYSFYGLTTLTEITIARNVRTIGSYAFQNCNNLETVEFAEDCALTTIQSYAFYNCPKIQSIELPNFVTAVQNYAFQSCTNLSNLTLDNRLQTIGEYAFQNCSGLTSVSFPASLTSVGYYSFGNCYNLETATFDPNVRITTIPQYLFYSCRTLSSISIPDTVTSIQSQAFFGCNSLTVVHIGKRVSSIAVDAFRSTDASTNHLPLNNITVDRDNEYYDDGTTWEGHDCLIDSTTHNLILGSRNTVIPKNAIGIGAYAFAYLPGLYDLEIPSNIRTIGEYAFIGCNGLVDIRTGSTTTTIGNYAFSKCQNLNVVRLTASISNIGSQAFGNCPALRTIVCYGEYPPVLSSNPFYNDNIVVIYVPNSEALQRFVGSWTAYQNLIEQPIPNQYQD